MNVIVAVVYSEHAVLIGCDMRPTSVERFWEEEK